MKKLAIMMFLFGASLFAQTSFSGIWNGKGGIGSARYGTVPQTSQMTLLQAGRSVQGTFKMGNGPGFEDNLRDCFREFDQPSCRQWRGNWNINAEWQSVEWEH